MLGPCHAHRAPPYWPERRLGHSEGPHTNQGTVEETWSVPGVVRMKGVKERISAHTGSRFEPVNAKRWILNVPLRPK